MLFLRARTLYIELRVQRRSSALQFYFRPFYCRFPLGLLQAREAAAQW